MSTANDLPLPLPGVGRLARELRRGRVLSKDCPAREVLQHVTSRWGVLVLVVLRDGVHRFSELRRKIGGVSEKMLAQTLQQLEGDGMLLREARPVVPPHVQYRLTPMGEEVARQVETLVDWIEVSLPRVLAHREAASASAAVEAPSRSSMTAG